MADYDLGTARGRVTIDSSGAVYGFGQAAAAQKGLQTSSAATAATLAKTGTVMAGAGVAVAAGIGFAVSKAADFQKTMNKVAAVSGATGDELKGLSDQAKTLGRTTKFTASEAAEGMTFLAMAGFETQEVMSAMPGVLNLAAAGNIDLARAADIASNVLTGYGMEASEINRVNDVMAETASSANTDINQLGDAMSYVAPVANASGLAFEETSAAIGKLSDAGIQGTRAGTTLRMIIARLENQTPKATEAIERLGISTHDSSGKLRSMTDIVGQFEKAGLSTADAMTIFGARAGPGMAALVDQGSASLEELEKQLANSGGRAKEMADKQMEGLSGALTELNSAFEGAMIAIGEVFLPILEKLADRLTAAISWFAGLDKSIITTIAVVAAIGAALAIAGGLFLMAFSAVQKLRGAFMALRLAMMANPIVLIVAALAALGIALVAAYNHFDGFRAAVDRAFAIFRDWIGPTIQRVVGWLKNLGAQLGNLWNMFSSGEATAQGFGEIMDNIFGNSGKYVSFFTNLYNAVVNAFGWIRDNVFPIVQRVASALGGWGNVLKILGVIIAAVVAPWATLVAGLIYAYNNFAIVRTVIQAVVNVLKSIITAIPPIIAAIVRFVTMMLTHFMSFVTWMRANVWPIFTALGALIAAIVNKVIVTIQRLMPIFRLVFNTIKSVIQNFVTIAQTVWKNFGDNLLSFITTAFNLIKSIVQSVLKVIQGIIKTVTGLIKGDWGQVWNGIKMILAGVWDAMMTVVKTVINLIMLAIQTVMDTIITIWDVAWNTISDTLSSIWETIKSAVSAAIEAVSNFISSGLEGIKSAWNTAWEAVKKFVSDAWATMKETVSSAIDAVVGFVKSIPGKFTSALSSLGQTLWDIANAAWDRFDSAVDAVVSRVISFVSGIPGKIIGALGNLGSLLYSAGKDVIQGLINGIKNMASAAARAAKDAVSGAIDAAKGFLGIGSPSKVFEEIGINTGEGFVIGLRDMIKDIDATSQVMVGSAVSGAAVASTAPASQPAPASPGPTPAPTMHIGQVVIPASDLQEIRDVQDFFDRIQQVARQGVE